MFKKNLVSLSVSGAFLLAGFSNLQAATYEADGAHSSVNFSIRHLLSKVTGHFDEFTGKFTTDEKTGNLKTLEGTVKANSINTANAKRDNHLKSADFFDVEKFETATVTFKDLNIKKGQKAKVKGDLTLHGVTKPVQFEIEYLGTAKDPSGAERAGLTAKADKVNRKDFGLTWNKPLEKAGEMLIGDDVSVEVNVEATISAKADAIAETKPATSDTMATKKAPAKK